MSNNLHALISASGLNTICKCPRFLYYKHNFKSNDSVSSNTYAVEGTYCHKIMELIITSLSFNTIKFYFKKVKKEKPHLFPHIKTALRQALAEIETSLTPNPIILPELKVNFGSLLNVDDKYAFGTTDLAIITNDEIKIIDYKFGAIAVSPYSLQLLVYAYGVLQHAQQLGFTPKRIQTIIIQPRRSEITYRAQFTIESLNEHLEPVKKLSNLVDYFLNDLESLPAKNICPNEYCPGINHGCPAGKMRDTFIHWSALQ